MAATGFGESARGLKRLRLPTVFSALAALRQARATTSAARILEELDPVALRVACADGVDLFDPDDTALVGVALSAIDYVAPLDLNTIEQEFSEGDGAPWLLPRPEGFACGWDEWSDYSSSPAEYAWAKMYIFWTAVRLQEGDTLERAGVEFGWLDWGLEIPGEWPDEIDWEAFEGALRKRGLGCHLAARAICWYDTGLDYFDWNPNDEGQFGDYPYRDFSIEGVRELQAEWEKARPMNVDYQLARDAFDIDPSLAGKLLALYCASRKKRRRRARARTLAEVFQEEQARGYVPERVRVRG
jgi:hypothetical protein